MNIKITSPSFSKHSILVRELKQLFPNAVVNEKQEQFKGETLKRYLSDADIAIVGLESITKELIDACPRLKFIAKYGVGLDNIDLEYCKIRNIGIGWSGGVNRLSVAEMTIGFMITTIRNMVYTSYQLKNGVWNKSGGYNLSGKTIGIIGVGHIGKEVIRLLQPFNCRILANDIVDNKSFYEQYNVIGTSKEDIYEQSDIVSVHTPLTECTQHMFNLDTFKKMKPSAILINTARGSIVNNHDLKVALDKHIIAGAALDTYEEEPIFDAELMKKERLFCTPHIGGNSNESILLMGRSAITHVKTFMEHQ